MMVLAADSMTPARAVEDPVFRTYAALAFGLLLLGGAVIGLLKTRGTSVGHALQSWRSWLVMVPLLFAVVLLGRVPTIVFFFLLALFSLKEWARATGLYEDWGMTGAAYLGILGCMAVTLVQDPGNGHPGWYGMYMALPVWLTAALFMVPILRNRTKGQLQTIALAIVGVIYIGWMFGHIAFLANTRYAYGYLLYVIFAVEVNDVAAYVCGRAFGRHPLRSNISPNKTWEGAVGAFVVSMALPWALWFSFPHFDATQLLLTGVIVGIGGQLGDLSISVIKRDLGVKDVGNLLPGHGGLLDRLDSLIFVAPLFFHMARYYHDLY